MYIQLLSLIFRLLALTGLVYNLWSISEIFFKFQITTEITIQIPNTYQPLDVHFCVRYNDLIPLNYKVSKLKNFTRLNETDQIRIIQHLVSLHEVFALTPNESSLLQVVEFRQKGSYEILSCAELECLEYFNVAKFFFMEYICYAVSLRQEKVSQSMDLIHLAVSPSFSGLSVRMVLKRTFNGAHFFKVALSKPGDYPYTELAYAPQRFGEHNFYLGYKSLKSKLLPAPYASNCFNYDTLGYKSQDDCFSKCVLEETLDRTRKLPFATILDDQSYGEKIVSYIDIQNKEMSDVIHRIHEFCMKRCHRRDCYKETLTTFVMPLSAKDENFVLAIVIPVDPAVDFKMNPKMSVPEFIIFVLSTISTWTSLSIMSLNPALLFKRGALEKLMNNITCLLCAKKQESPVHSYPNRDVLRSEAWRHCRTSQLPTMEYIPPPKSHLSRWK